MLRCRSLLGSHCPPARQVISALQSDRSDGPVASWPVCWWEGAFLPSLKVKGNLSPFLINSLQSFCWSVFLKMWSSAYTGWYCQLTELLVSLCFCWHCSSSDDGAWGEQLGKGFAAAAVITLPGQPYVLCAPSHFAKMWSENVRSL